MGGAAEHRRAGIDAIALFNGVAAVAIGVLGAAVLIAILLQGVTDPVRDLAIPVVVGASLIALGATILATATDLLDRREDGRQATIAVAAVALVTFYLQIQVVALLVSGTLVLFDPLILGVGAVAAIAYAAPILYYLTRDDVRHVFAYEEETLSGEPVGTRADGVRILEGTVVEGEEIEGRDVPEGAVARTRCTRCEASIAVAARERPVVVECPRCGMHGELAELRRRSQPPRRNVGYT